MEQLRFALLYDGARLERWHLGCLEELERVAELVGIVVAQESALHAPPRPRSRLLRWYGQRLAQAAAVSVADRFAHLPASSLERGAVDFVLRLGRVAVPAGVAERARLGLWSFEHEAEGTELPFFAEVYAGADVTRAALVAIRSGRDVSVLVEGAFRTDKRSYTASRNRIQDAITSWPARVCRRVGSGGAVDALNEAVTPAGESPAEGASLALFAARIASRRAGLAWTRLFRHPQWNVGVLRRPVQTLLTTGTYTDEEVEWFPLEGRAGFLADPFAIAREGRLHILCEYFDYRESSGRICALEYSVDGFSSQPVDALSLALHVSYPYVLDVPEGVFCVPETAAGKEVAMYRASELPGSWSKAGVILPDFAGVDPTMFRHEERWWLVCTRQGPQEDAELWVWHAPEIAGPWTPHDLNPVKTDVRGARPGGAPFVHDGTLYRPAQDCSKAYGGRITLQRVIRLTPTEFVEELAAVVEASSSSRFPLGPHTLTPIGNVVLVDGRRTIFVPVAFRAFLGIWGRAIVRRARRAG
ncbi:MAG: hypothetical protein MSC30_05210 [Gaiellaceae bacterium MAG52_C11]|nr:hypothetical protein [Candidatus Gaiellasilicea maunaloa]